MLFRSTIFNLLGPLSNPAGAEFQIIGVFDRPLVTLVAEALARLGIKRAHHSLGDLPADRCAELSQIGMVWDMKAFRWSSRFRELKEHLEQEATIPRQHMSPLGNWCSVQRKRHKHSKLPADRVTELESLGPVWHWS